MMGWRGIPGAARRQDRQRLDAKVAVPPWLALAIGAVVGMATIAAAQPRTGAPGFDCGQATRPLEVAICTNAVLAALDGALGAAYAARSNSVPSTTRARLAEEQRGWLRSRLDCPIPADPDRDRPGMWAAVPCLTELYRARIVALGGIVPAFARPVATEILPPLCVGALLERRPPYAIDTAACRIALRHNPIDQREDGFRFQANTDFRDQAEEVGFRQVGTLEDGSAVLLVTNNSGGSGRFTSMLRVRRTRDRLALEAAMDNGGDRCDGGVREATLLDERHLLVVVNVTPRRLAALADAESWAAGRAAPAPDDRLDGLPEAPIACIGHAIYALDVFDGQARLLGAVLRQSPREFDMGRLSGCLADAIRTARVTPPGPMDGAALGEMRRMFQRTCLRAR